MLHVSSSYISDFYPKDLRKLHAHGTTEIQPTLWQGKWQPTGEEHTGERGHFVQPHQSKPYTHGKTFDGEGWRERLQIPETLNCGEKMTTRICTWPTQEWRGRKYSASLPGLSVCLLTRCFWTCSCFLDFLKTTMVGQLHPTPQIPGPVWASCFLRGFLLSLSLQKSSEI